MSRVVLLIVMALALFGVAHAQPLPMPPTQEAPAADASWWGETMAYVNQVQGDLWRGLAKAVRAVKDEGSIGALAWLMGLAFFYGVIHAAGPGHGKAVIAAYLVGTESAVRRGIVLSFLSAAAQGVTAICAVGLLAALLGFVSKEVADMTRPLEILGAVMIAGIGAYILATTVRGILSGRAPHDHSHSHAPHEHAHDHGHHHDHEHGHAHTHVAPAEARDWRSGVAVVAAVGLRPCMGAILVLLFALSYGVFFVGVLATAAMSLGTGITVAALALLSSGARHVALRLAGTMDGWLLKTYWALSLVGGIALVLIGVSLLIAPPAPPFPGAG
jgi:ABC-type nickel/cobalt efflux system permease component RcnA